MRRSTILFLFFIGVRLNAQDLVVYGRVREHEQQRPIAEGVLGISSEGVQYIKVNCDSTGYYRLTLDVGKRWDIRYAAPGRVGKTIAFDLRNMPKDDGGHGINVDVRLFLDDAAQDFGFLEEPMGICHWDGTTKKLTWDAEYMLPRKQRLSAMMPEQYELVPDSVLIRGQEE